MNLCVAKDKSFNNLRKMCVIIYCDFLTTRIACCNLSQHSSVVRCNMSSIIDYLRMCVFVNHFHNMHFSRVAICDFWQHLPDVCCLLDVVLDYFFCSDWTGLD